MPLLCWHYTPSLWPWSLWTLSCSVSMTTTQGRLLVTCVGGFACTEWELHNQLNRERVFGSAQQFEMRFNFIYHIIEPLQSMWLKMVRWLCFFSSRPAPVVLTPLYNCCGSHYSPNLEVRSCAWGLQLARERSKKEKPLICPRPPDTGIKTSSYRPQAHCLSARGRKSQHPIWRIPFAETGKAWNCITDLSQCHLFC